MHAQTLLCATTAAASRPGSGLGALRACMHAQTLLCATTAAASRPGSGAGTLQARMHAQTLLCGTTVIARLSTPAANGAAQSYSITVTVTNIGERLSC